MLAFQRSMIVMIATFSQDHFMITGTLHAMVAAVFMLLQLNYKP
jgi:hypothetical protein